MSEWIVDVQSMVPMGCLGERMVVAKVDRMTNECEIMCAPMMRKHNACAALGNDEVFMEVGSFSGPFGKGEIDQFLQAMMDAGWKRGLRPVGFDPSAGELAAVNRHLEDIRKLLHADAPKLAEYGPSNPDIGTGGG